MRIETADTASLHLDPNNTRVHTDETLEMLCRSLKEFGQYKPLIVDKSTNVVLAGNGRLMAMRRLKWAECKIIYIEGKENVGIEILDNKLNEMSTWDDNEINSWLAEEKGLDWWGISADLSSAILESNKKKEEKQKQGDDSKTVKPKTHLCCPKCGKKVKRKMI